jgi:hypothetical protein
MNESFRKVAARFRMAPEQLTHTQVTMQSSGAALVSWSSSCIPHGLRCTFDSYVAAPYLIAALHHAKERHCALPLLLLQLLVVCAFSSEKLPCKRLASPRPYTSETLEKHMPCVPSVHLRCALLSAVAILNRDGVGSTFFKIGMEIFSTQT